MPNTVLQYLPWTQFAFQKKKQDSLAVNFVSAFSPSLHLQQSQTNLALGWLRLQ